MQFKVLEDKDNKLLNRRELVIEVRVEGKTPSNMEVKKRLTESFKVSEELIVVDHIYQEFGGSKAKVYAKIYKSEEDLKKIEKIKKRKEEKSKIKEEKKSEEKKQVKEEEGGETKQKKEESKDKGEEEEKKQEA